MTFLNSKYARIVTVVLILQGIVFYSVALRAENTPPAAPAGGLPDRFAGWQMYKDVQIEQETLDILKADDTLNRIYVNPGAQRQHLPLYRVFQDATLRTVSALAEELPAGKRL